LDEEIEEDEVKHVTRMGEKVNAYIVLSWEREHRERPLGRPRNCWERKFEIDVQVWTGFFFWGGGGA
jgi:hypothetical protein